MTNNDNRRTADFSPEEFFASYESLAQGSQTIQLGDAKVVDSASENSFTIATGSILEVAGKKYGAIEHIGKGCNGGVVLCKELSENSQGTDNSEVVIKYAFEGREEAIRREISYMDKLSHKGIVRLLGSGMIDAQVQRNGVDEKRSLEVLVAERLFENPYCHYAKPLAPAIAIDVYVNSLLNLEDIHRAKFIHGDIKPENLLLRANLQLSKASRRVPRLSEEEENVQSYRDRCYAFMLMYGEYMPVLGDLGCAVDMSSRVLKEYPATPAYLCPEAMLDFKMGPKRDVWALTVSFIEMLTGIKPYADMNGLAGIGKAMIAKTLPFDLSRVLDRTFLPVLQECQDKELYQALEKVGSDIQKIADRGIVMDPARRASTFELIELCVNLFKVRSTSYTDSDGVVQKRWTQSVLPKLQPGDSFFKRRK